MQTKLLTQWVIIWVLAIAVLVVIRWRRKISGSGLVFAFLLNLSLIHWLGAFIYILPWYEYQWNAQWYRDFSPQWIEDGFRLSFYGLIAFVVGSSIIAPFLINALQRKKSTMNYLSDPRLPKAYVLTGFICYFVLSRFLGRIPTLASLLSSGLGLMAAGICMGLWGAWKDKRRRLFRKWLIFGLSVPPLLTIGGQGFLSFGAGVFLAVVAFVASFYRPRWKVIVIGILLGYVGLSFYVTYMRDRSLIREAVWGGQSLPSRIKQMYSMASSFEWFDLYDQNHLKKIDARMNLNLLVGAAVSHLGKNHNYAKGETILQSLAAFVPRALWPDKPLKVGGNQLATRFTGIPFPQETSVGIGEVIEFYANFGEVGVIVGFFFMGMIVTIFDAFAKDCFSRGDWRGFSLWFVPGLTLIEAGSSLVVITASVGGAFIMTVIVNQWLNRFKGRRLLSVSQ